MSGITTQLGNGSSITLEPVTPTRTNPDRRILLTLDGTVHGQALNCALIPVACIPKLIAALQLTENMLYGHGH